ncbi:MAG: antitoxin family protein [Methanomicrobia archaeon]|nr:antitoxin family protein [Methanomicrobia archaeon]
MEEIEVIYENGVFKPVKKVNLKEKEKVKIRVVGDIVEKTRGIIKIDKKSLDNLLEEVEDEWGFH